MTSLHRPLRVLAWPADANRTGNPYNALLARGLRDLGVTVDEFSPRRLMNGRYDVWHAHWPEGGMGKGGAARAMAGATATLGLAARARMRGTCVVWTVHNLRAHNQAHPTVERVFWQGWARLVDASLHLSEAGREAALEQFPALRDKPSFVVPHPHYRTAYAPSPPKAEARGQLGLPLDARIVAFVGHIQAYKNVPALVHAFRELDDPTARLLVAGRPATVQLAHEIKDAARGDSRIDLRLKRVPDDELAVVVGAADVVALPYAEVLNSGVALLALSLDRPVLVPAAGAMPDLRAALGPAWVRVFVPPLSPGNIAAALATTTRAGRPEQAPLASYSPDAVARATLAVYRVVVGAKGERLRR
jgi:beta-1,4-mannosyltransferase